MLPAFTLPSFAKINWTLRILGKREDSFHELFTVFQTVSLHDSLTFEMSNGLTLTSNLKYLPTDERNLVIKAAKALQQRFDIKKGAAIHLEKRIPTPGGLGGGSSNAAVALIGLKRLWQIDCNCNDLQEIASELGSDTPFFLHGGTAIGTGRGEIIEPISDVHGEFMLIATPKVRVSTRVAFSKIEAETLTNEAAEHNLSVCRLEAESFDLRHSALKNDFEKSVFSAFPEIERVKTTLLDLGAVNAAMSGSGASVFAIFDKEETWQTAKKALDREVNWRKFAVSTVSRSSYREAMQLQGS
ncbi:MAG: 4-(cytidine 5'-diphospho)-2-C-methyl-D-erythritol kinase [Chloracidobacterium sp.]|nr:4-(cytidine 5'-diphospho)-2-C-methyl-D-erythritol kinase [Chloracidobacterium sp.]